MAKLREEVYEGAFFARYQLDKVDSHQSAINWIYSVIRSGIIRVDRISLCDDSRSTEDGGGSTDFSLTVGEEEFKRECERLGGTDIFIRGYYHHVRATVRVFFDTYEISLIIEEGPESVNLESELGLNN